MSDQGPRALDGDRFCHLCAGRVDDGPCCKDRAPQLPGLRPMTVDDYSDEYGSSSARQVEQPGP